MALFVLWVIHHLLVVGPIFFVVVVAYCTPKASLPVFAFFANIVTVFVKGNELAQVLA